MINRSVMPGKKKKIVPGSQSSTQTGGQSSEKASQSVMESALDSSLTSMKIDMAKNILAEGGDKKSKKSKKEKKKKKKRSSTSSTESESKEEIDMDELAMQLAMKPKHFKLKDMMRYEDLSAVALPISRSKALSVLGLECENQKQRYIRHTVCLLICNEDWLVIMDTL